MYQTYPYVSDGQVKEMIALLEKWFRKIEDGTANLCMPEEDKKRIETERVDRLIKEIDDYTLYEVTSHPEYWAGVNEFQIRNWGMPALISDKAITEPAGFNRLQGASREAFAQEVFALADEFKG